MKKEMFVLFVLVLFISGCDGLPTGKGVIDSEIDSEVPMEINEDIKECVTLCNDGSRSEEYFINSCSNILEFGGKEVFKDYMSHCGD